MGALFRPDVASPWLANRSPLGGWEMPSVAPLALWCGGQPSPEWWGEFIWLPTVAHSEMQASEGCWT